MQAVAVLRELGIDPAKVNVNGGAVALGHAIGSSGGRVLTTLIYALKRRNLKRGIATLCLGGGNGVALAVERSSTRTSENRSDVSSRAFVLREFQGVRPQMIKTDRNRRRRHDGQRYRAGVRAGGLHRSPRRRRAAAASIARAARSRRASTKFVEKGKLTAGDRDAALGRLTTTTTLDKPWRTADYVVEAIVENAGRASARCSRASTRSVSEHAILAVQHLVDLDHVARRGDRSGPTRCSACTS